MVLAALTAEGAERFHNNELFVPSCGVNFQLLLTLLAFFRRSFNNTKHIIASLVCDVCLRANRAKEINQRDCLIKCTRKR